MHIYDGPNGEKLPSVTTVLSIIGNESIIKWANSIGFKHIDYTTELNRTAANGTKLHSLLREEVDPSFKSSIEFRDSLEESDYIVKLNRFREMISLYNYETIFTEKTFISSKLGYAGTIDWVANINNFVMLNDFKSSSKVHIKHLLQLGGYYNLLREDSISVDGGSIILVNNKLSLLYPISAEVLSFFGEGFNKLFEFYKFNDGLSIKTDTEFKKKLLTGR